MHGHIHFVCNKAFVANLCTVKPGYNEQHDPTLFVRYMKWFDITKPVCKELQYQICYKQCEQLIENVISKRNILLRYVHLFAVH